MTRFAAIQTVSTPDLVRNLDAAARLVADAARAGATWIGLPEYFCLTSPIVVHPMAKICQLVFGMSMTTYPMAVASESSWSFLHPT